jgi:sugar/nucleoside kinase (ribokinase family)
MFDMSKILVVGSVHMDIVADFKPDTAQNIDKIGNLRFSVGGAAYNIAANLAYHRQHHVALLSVIKEGSLSDNLIANYLAQSDIDCRFLVKARDIPESGFVAHICQSRLISAVSCVAIEQVPLPEKQFEAAMDWAEIIAVETNLSAETLDKVISAAGERKKPVLACCVSESKVDRLHRQAENGKFRLEAVVMNQTEAAAVGYSMNSADWNRDFSKRLCEHFSAKIVFITQGERGYDAFLRGGDHRHFDAMNIPNVVSTLGAGDAFFAAVISSAPKIDLLKSSETIRNYLLPVLTTTNAAPQVQNKRVTASMSVTGLQISIAATLFLIGLILAAIGQFFDKLSYGWAGALFLSVPLFAGAGGGITGEILKQVKTKFEPVQFSIKECFLGGVAGVLAAILFGLPYLTLNPPEISRVSILRNLMLYDFVFSIVAGLTFQSYLQRLILKTHPPDKLRVDSHVNKGSLSNQDDNI